MSKKLVIAIMVFAMSAMSLLADPALRAVAVKNIEATQSENMEALLKLWHTQSPSFAPMKKQLPPLFQAYDLKYELLAFEFVGVSGEYAISRTKQKASKVKGPDYRDNVIDMIQIFRKEDGKWKYWAQSILTVEYL